MSETKKENGVSKSFSRLSIEASRSDDEVAGEQRGSTSADTQDMARMGRVQELQVCSTRDVSIFTSTHSSAARIQIRWHRWIRHYSASNLGKHSASELLWPVQWRDWWRNMVYNRCLALHALHDSVHGRDGIDGAHSRRSANMHLTSRSLIADNSQDNTTGSVAL